MARTLALGVVAVGLLWLAVACAELPESTASTRPQPPPRPGSSITHSRMCSCTACARTRCCQGADSAELAADVGPCESYDFSKAGCSLEVGSCASRCFERMWRVRLDQSCDDKRPEECCG
jgi:hypothetical protein